jgi:hypothetical protein
MTDTPQGQKLHARYEWLDQSRGVVSIMYIFAIITYRMSGVPILGSPQLGPTFLNHGYKYYNGVTPLDGDIPVEEGTGTGGSDTIFQLRNDLADVLTEKGIAISDHFMAQVPVFINHPGENDVSRGWVVPLNRQAIRFVPFPGPFPMTEEFIGALESLRNDFSDPLEDE